MVWGLPKGCNHPAVLVTAYRPDPQRSFGLMDKYSDLPMGFADASLLAVAEKLGTAKIFTLDFTDFNVYRYKKGHRHYVLDLIGRKLLE